MAAISKPIKRSTQLAPLSREHHDGLLGAWKIRQGISKNIESRRISAFVQWFWQQHLQAHFKKEEAAFPAVLSAADPLLQQMKREHKEIGTLSQGITEHGDYKNLEKLAQLLTDHIRFEERVLFAEVEKKATTEQLQRLAEQLRDEKKEAVYEDEFWIIPK